jgi:hypothetical protein
MNDERRNGERVKERLEADVQERSRSLNGQLDPAEMGRRSGQARRERRARAERDAEHDRLTVSARLAVVTAAKLTTSELRAVVEGLITRAKGDGHVANAAAAQLLAMARAAVEGGEDETDGIAYEDMTPAQRAAFRAALDKEILAAREELGTTTPDDE